MTAACILIGAALVGYAVILHRDSVDLLRRDFVVFRRDITDIAAAAERRPRDADGR